MKPLGNPGLGLCGPHRARGRGDRRRRGLNRRRLRAGRCPGGLQPTAQPQRRPTRKAEAGPVGCVVGSTEPTRTRE